MSQTLGIVADRAALAAVVAQVGRRWRYKHALFRLALALAAGFAAFALLAWLLRLAHYAGWALLGARFLAVGALGVAAWRGVQWVRRRAPADASLAMYVEERERTMGGALMTALDATRPDRAEASSPALLTRLLEVARQRLRRVDDATSVDAAGLRQGIAAVALVVATGVTLLVVGPATLRTGARLLLTPWAGTSATAAFRIEVLPGNATMARGGDQLITATLQQFDAVLVELLVRDGPDARWVRLPMTADSVGRYAFRLMDVSARTDYAVEAAGVRSPTYRLEVANLPYVQRLDLEYRFPAYTGLAPERVDSTGDIAALKGTMVRLHVTPTIPTTGGRVIVDGGDTLRLARLADGSLMAALRVGRAGFYRVQLDGPDGVPVTASLDYLIDVIPDRAPAVRFTKPGRDLRVLGVDEVYVEARAEDDYGIGALEVVYSVNGGDEQVVSLHRALRATRDVSAGYTFMLEESALAPGDVVSYYARARDNDAVSGAKEASSDIYFLQVRPYGLDYRQQQGGGAPAAGQQQQQQDSPGQLSQQQREIISATFNVVRDSGALAAAELKENVSTIRLSQQKLRERAADVARRLVERGIASNDSGFKKIAAILPRAVAQMDSAERRLAVSAPRGALPHEQRALAELQRAEAVFREIQVSQGGEGGGGGGGGGGQNAQDLADLFELQRDRLRNQYETVNSGAQGEQAQNANAEVDAALERLRQLAARQQQQDARAQRKADSLSQRGQSGTGAGDAQRELAQETEQAARQLERLARERNSPQVADAARRLQDAADQMRRAAASGQSGGAASRNASDRMQEARRLLDEERRASAGRGVSQAQQQARDIAEQERQIAGEVQQLAQPNADRERLQQSIADRKGQMASQLRDLTSQLDRMALENARERPQAASALRAAADSLRSRRTLDRVRASQQFVRTAPAEYMGQFESAIVADISQLQDQMREAGEAVARGEQPTDAGRVLDRMRQLVRGLESVDDRLRQRQSAQQQGAFGGSAAGDPRQIVRELQERLGDARALRQDLQRQGIDVAPLDRALEGLRNTSNAQSLDDPRASAALQQQVIDQLKAYEFALRRTLGGQEPQVLQGRTGEVPARFRAYVEQYYRSLARPKP